jgi:hypothetical protein
VTGRIDQPDSCLGLWLAYTASKIYRLEVCTDSWRLVQEDQGNGDGKLLHRWPVTVAGVGKDVRLQAAVENDVVRIGHDGVPVGELALPEKDVTGGDFSLGVISKDSATKGPFRDSFKDIEIRLAS